MPSTIRTPRAYAKRLTSCTARFRRSPRSPATRRPTWKTLQPAECSTKPSPLWSDLTSVPPNSPGWQAGSRSRLSSSWRSLPQTPTGQPALDTAGREHPASLLLLTAVSGRPRPADHSVRASRAASGCPSQDPHLCVHRLLQSDHGQAHSLALLRGTEGPEGNRVKISARLD